MLALMRGMELYEHVADRLTLVGGYPVEVVNIGFAYNEDTLKRCIAGEVKDYEATAVGRQGFRTHVPRNAHLPSLVIPPPIAFEAIRWFRHAMLTTRILDQYLFYHIALESIARHVPGVVRGPKTNPQGEVQVGLESQEAAAIKFLLQRRKLPLDGRVTLAKIRGKIAHGDTDTETIQMAHANMRVIQRLAADGLSIVCGIEPDAFSVLEPYPFQFMVPIGRADYSSDDNPTTAWGDLLSDVHRRYIEEAQHLSAASQRSE
jgi:hypothetical protein